jgi:hypothetical protein
VRKVRLTWRAVLGSHGLQPRVIRPPCSQQNRSLRLPAEHGQLRRYHGRHLFPHPLLINQQYDYPASGSKKTLWQNRERCYKGFIDHHQRTSCEAFVRGPRTSQKSFIARGSKACSRGPEGPLRWWIDGSAYSFAKQQRQLQVRDRIRGGSIARLRTSCRSREKVVVARMAGSCHRSHAADQLSFTSKTK